MLTVIESPLFTRLWPDYWSEEERAEFAVPAYVLKQIAEEMGHATS
jgi:hypothetical protein